MGGTGIPDGFRRADCDICRKPAASSEIDWRAGVCGGSDIGFVRGGGESRGANRVARRDVFVEILALLAALVPASVFSVCFEEMSKLVHLVSPGWQDARLIAFD